MGGWGCGEDAFSGVVFSALLTRPCGRRSIRTYVQFWWMSVFVQRVLMPVTGAVSWTVLGVDGAVVEPIESYLSYLAALERSARTARMCGFSDLGHTRVQQGTLRWATAVRSERSRISTVGEPVDKQLEVVAHGLGDWELAVGVEPLEPDAVEVGDDC